MHKMAVILYPASDIFRRDEADNQTCHSKIPQHIDIMINILQFSR